MQSPKKMRSNVRINEQNIELNTISEEQDLSD